MTVINRAFSEESKRYYLGIDPGPVDSAYAIIDHDYRPVDFDKINNLALRDTLPILSRGCTAAIEKVACYGMPVGAEVLETCEWIGRFTERSSVPLQPVFRLNVRLHHCHSTKSKDSNVRQALVDRFSPGAANYGKGTKADPGWFYGFRADIWQAAALAIYLADLTEQGSAT